MTRKGQGYVGAPNTQYGFEQEVAKLCECKFAGEGWSQYKAEEPISKTVERVMPDADWVIDHDNNLHVKKPKGRKYKVGHFISDLHAKHYYNTHSPMEYTTLLNKADYDAVFMRYPLLYGTRHRPDVVYDNLACDKHWIPWSVNTEFYHTDEKTVDVGFIGTLGKCYPLRESMWEGIYYAARGHKIIRETSPKGKTYERLVESLKDTYLVGERYRDALAKTRIFMFGCSIYRYPLQKFFEAMASGCLVMSNSPGMAKKLGFVDGDTYVDVCEVDWEERLLYLLDNPDVVKKIADSGMDCVVKHHNHVKRAKQFIEMLQK